MQRYFKQDSEDRDLPDTILDPEQAIALNGWWWNHTPNETYDKVMWDGETMSWPTNRLTVYTLEQIGNNALIPEINNYCVTLQGQPSTLSGEDTRPDAEFDESVLNYAPQRGYLDILLPTERALALLEHFHPSSPLAIVYRHYGDSVKYNDVAKNLITGRGAKKHIWLTRSLQVNGDDMSLIAAQDATNVWLDPQDIIGPFDDVDTERSGFTSLTPHLKLQLEGLTYMTFITSEVGLDDPPEAVTGFLATDPEFMVDIEVDTGRPSFILRELLAYFKSQRRQRPQRSQRAQGSQRTQMP